MPAPLALNNFSKWTMQVCMHLLMPMLSKCQDNNRTSAFKLQLPYFLAELKRTV